MSSEAPSVPTEAVVAQNEGGGGVGESTTSTSPVVPPVSTATESAPSEVVESKPTAEVPLSQRLKVTMDMPVSAPTSKKERPKLVLAPWQPDDGVSECQHCKRTFNPLFLRFKVCHIALMVESRVQVGLPSIVVYIAFSWPHLRLLER